MTDTVTTTTDTTGLQPRASDFVRQHAGDRRHGLEFLAAHAMGLGSAYSLSVSSSGLVHIQGEPGTLQHLVERWNAPIAAHQPSNFRAWETRVPFGRHDIPVEIVEETNVEHPALVTA